MSVWWDNSDAPAAVENGVPVVIPGGRAEAISALQARIAGFVPEWRDLSDEDAGVALVRLFGLQLDPILARANRLPEKALVEFLRAAGLSPAAPRSAATIVAFTPEATNTGPVSVPPDTKLTSARSDGEQGNVTWETHESVTVANAQLSEIHRFDGEITTPVAEGEPFRPFGDLPEPEAALYLGFTIEGDPGIALSLAILMEQTDLPLPVAAGGVAQATTPRVTTRWEALTPSGFQQIDVAADTSAGLTRTGILGLALPRDWAADRPQVLGDGDPLHWLRLRLTSGMPTGDAVASIMPHAVAATARETFRAEFPVPETDGQQVTVKLRHVPVLSGTIVLEVDEGIASADLFDLPDEPEETEGTFRLWREVPSLAGQRADARVFTLDPATGTLTFGDNVEGIRPPPGIRNIAVREYAITLGGAGNVGIDEVSRLPNGVRGIASATNPIRGSGGAHAESVDETVRRGPAMIKARGRAVSTTDTALLARFTEGADILRAYALSGVDATLGGAVRPGTVSVMVLPRRHPSDPPDLPPVVSSETLNAVARHLAEDTGPLGARVVAAAPRFQKVRIEATITVAAGRDPAAAEAAVRAALDRHLNPELTDWPIGATLRHADILQVVLSASDNITAVPFLIIVLDGIGREACTDARLARFGLPWPARHRLVVEQAEVTS